MELTPTQHSSQNNNSFFSHHAIHHPNSISHKSIQRKVCFSHTLSLAGPWLSFGPISTYFITVLPSLEECLNPSSCLSPSRPMEPVLDISDKVICQHCKFRVGSCHLLFPMTISLFNDLIRHKSMPMIPSEDAEKKSTFELTWWQMAPLTSNKKC